MTHWPHAPPHFSKDQGIYMITAGTYLKVNYFKAPDRVQLVHDRLLSLSQTYAWELHAWAVFSNHYHFIAKSPPDPSNLSSWLAILHQSTTSEVNSIDQTPNRKVWHQFWDTKITIPTSYLARLNSSVDSISIWDMRRNGTVNALKCFYCSIAPHIPTATTVNNEWIAGHGYYSNKRHSFLFY